MSLQRFLIGTAQALGDDEVAIIAITAGIKRDGDEWIPAGIDLTNYQRNPIVLDGHDPRHPIGVAAVALSGHQIEGRIQFAPLGISEHADRARGLAKAGVLSGVSAGIDPIETEPLDPRNPRSGVRVLRADLLELSLVAVPADTSARIVARSYAGQASRAALLRRLPAIPPGALARLHQTMTTTPEERSLIALGAELGAQVTPEYARTVIREARQLAQSPTYRLRFIAAGRGMPARGDDHAQRMATARELARPR